MNIEVFKKDIFPKDFVLQLYTKFSTENYKERLQLLDNFFEQNKATIDLDVLKLNVNSLKGLVLFQAEKYKEATDFLKSALLFPIHLNPYFYFINITLLIACYRLLEEYLQAKELIFQAINNLQESENSFELLKLMEEYFLIFPYLNEKTPDTLFPLMEKIEKDLEFFDFPTESIHDRVLYLATLNKTTSRAYGNICIGAGDDKIQKLKDFIAECKLPFYAKLAEEQIQSLTN